MRIVEGTGRRQIYGQFDQLGREAVQVAISLVSVHAPRLRRWLHGPAAEGEEGAAAGLPLYSSGTDVHVEFGPDKSEKSGSSMGMSVALALTCLLRPHVQHRPLKIAVSGGVDLCGKLEAIEGTQDKIRNAFSQQLDLLILPEEVGRYFD